MAFLCSSEPLKVEKSLKEWRKICIISILILLIMPVSAVLYSYARLASQGEIKLYLTSLNVDGMYVKNGYGQVVHLTGVHWADLVDKDRFFCGPGEHEWQINISIRTRIAREMGGNHIRYSIHLQKYANPFSNEGYNATVKYRQEMDKAVQALINYNLYGYFVFHYGSHSDDEFMEALLNNDPWTFEYRQWNSDIGEWETVDSYTSPAVRDDWMDWCEDIAAHYRETPNVFGYQIWAEPGWGRFDNNRTNTNFEMLFQQWWQFNLDTARAIHRGNPDAIIIVMSPGYYWNNYMSPNQWDGRVLPEHNIMYGVQKYESEDHRGQAGAKAYWEAYVDWHEGGNTTLEEARALQEEWYVHYVFNFSLNNQVPVINTEFAYSDDLSWNYKDDKDWGHCPEQAEGFYDIWRKYQQGWTQHRWQVGSSFGGGSYWGFFASVDTPNSGDYELAPSGEFMSQNFSPLWCW